MSQKLYSERELAEFNNAVERVMKHLGKLKKGVRTEREGLFLMIGMSASHIEESITYGDPERARAHLKRMIGMMRKL